jgi:hypothetical protein
MRKPEIIDVYNLVANPHCVSTEWTLPSGRKWWGPARAYGWNQLRFFGRLKAAWLVFTGNADALVWPDRA